MVQQFSTLLKKAKTVIHTVLYLTLATVNKKGQPWNSPVYTAFDEEYTFYWTSWALNQHSQNINENETVFAVIYDSSAPEGTEFGVYLQGKAYQLDTKDIAEIQKALILMSERSDKPSKSAQEFVGAFPQRVFKFVPEEVWVNVDDHIDGHYIDTRVELTDELLHSH